MSTTPLTKWLYPPWYQNKMEKWRRGEIDKDGNPIHSASSGGGDYAEKMSSAEIRRLLVYLRLDSLPGLFTFIALLGADKDKEAQRTDSEDAKTSGEDLGPSARRPLEVHGLRILELTERTSSVMRVTEGEEYYSERDPVVNAFRTFSRLNDVAVSGKVSVVPTSSYAETLTKQAADVASDFVLVPWSEYGSITEDTSVLDATSTQERFTGRTHLDFVSQVLQNNVCNTGVFINRGFGGPSDRPSLKRPHSVLSVRSQSARDSGTLAPIKDKTHHLFLPFFGGVDDRVALRFALRLARNPNVTLTVMHLSWAGTDSGDEVDVPSKAVLVGGGDGSSGGDKGAVGGSLKVIDETSAQDAALLASLGHALPRELVGRVTVSEVSVTRGTAAAEAASRARMLVGNAPRNAGDIVVVGRTHRDLGDDLAEVGGSELRRTVGVVAQELVDSGVKASLLVVKAGGAGLHW